MISFADNDSQSANGDRDLEGHRAKLHTRSAVHAGMTRLE